MNKYVIAAMLFALFFVLLFGSCAHREVRDDHGCLKERCYWKHDTQYGDHCSCEGDWDFGLLN
jgi:hypothetical protein